MFSTYPKFLEHYKSVSRKGWCSRLSSNIDDVVVALSANNFRLILYNYNLPKGGPKGQTQKMVLFAPWVFLVIWVAILLLRCKTRKFQAMLREAISRNKSHWILYFLPFLSCFSGNGLYVWYRIIYKTISACRRTAIGLLYNCIVENNRCGLTEATFWRNASSVGTGS